MSSTSDAENHVREIPLTRQGMVRMFWHRGFYDRHRPWRMLRNLLVRGHLYTKTYNAGDDISPIVVGRLASRDVAYVSVLFGSRKLRVIRSASSPKLIAIGSVMGAAKPRDWVWGAGLKHASDAKIVQNDVRIRAVRGPRTRQALIDNNMQCPDVFGDPGILLSYVLPMERTSEYQLGIIPHKQQVVEFREEFEGIKRESHGRMCLIDPAQSWQGYMDQLRKCQIIASGSLHGVILAESYGIPAITVKFGSFPAGDSFKFEDYYESTGRPFAYVEAPVLSRHGEIKEALYEMPTGQLDLRPLLKAFPLKIEHPSLKRMLESEAELVHKIHTYGVK